MSSPRLVPETGTPGRVAFDVGSEVLELSRDDFSELSRAQQVVETLVTKARAAKAQLRPHENASAA